MQNLDKARIVDAHEPRWESVWIWLTLVGIFLAAQALITVAVMQGIAWLVAPLVLFTAYLMHTHLLAFHEASHETLCPNKFLNEALGILIGVLGFMSLSLYRFVHHAHHAYLTSERDEELWPFVNTDKPRWLRCLAAYAELALGLVYTPLLFLRCFLRAGSPIQDPRVRRRIWMELALMVVIWTFIGSVVTWLQAWPVYVFLFVIPAALAGSIQTFRKFIEHMGMLGTTVVGVTRTVVPDTALGRLMALSMFHISYHGVHHKYARMHHSELPQFTQIVTPEAADEKPPFRSYFAALADMVGTLDNPRVGGQWLDHLSSRSVRKTLRIGAVHSGTMAAGADGT